MLGFMQGIGGEVESYNFDIEASKKLNEIKLVMAVIKETNNKNEEYCRGVNDVLIAIKDIIEK